MNKKETVLLKKHLAIGKAGTKANELLFMPGEGKQYFPKPFPKRWRWLRSYWNLVKHMIPIMKIRFFQ